MGINIVLRGEGDMKKSDYDADEDLKIDGAMYKSTYDNDEDGLIKETNLLLDTIPSDNLKNSNDSEEFTSSDNWVLVKKFVIKTKGNYKLRCKVDVTDNYSDGSYDYINVKVVKYKDGAETDMWSYSGRNDAWETIQSSDMDFGLLNPNDEIRLYIHGLYKVECHVKNWRLYYDITATRDMNIWSLSG